MFLKVDFVITPIPGGLWAGQEKGSQSLALGLERLIPCGCGILALHLLILGASMEF